MNLPLGIGLLLLALSIAGILGSKLLKIPDIVLYLLLGIGVSSFFHENHTIEVAGEIGIVILFFLLGMEFSVERIVSNGKRVWKAGLLDAFLGIGVTFGICLLFGQSFFNSLLIGGVVYATSSSITAKLMEHKDRMENKESSFMLSLLIFEDLVAPILLTILMGMEGEGFTPLDFVFIFLKIALLVAVAIFFSKFVFKKMNAFFKKASADDTFVLLLIGIALTYGGVALYFELSEVIGAFLAGIMLAETAIKEKIEKVVLPVRNIFLPLFFLNFGLSLELTKDIPGLGLLIVLIVWSIVQKIAVGYFGGQWYGLSKRDALLAGISLTQRGEFSVVLAGLASGALKIFTGIYILAAALIGMVLFQLAPRLNKVIFKKLQKDDAD